MRLDRMLKVKAPVADNLPRDTDSVTPPPRVCAAQEEGNVLLMNDLVILLVVAVGMAIGIAVLLQVL
jgi:hypothetical protein